MNLPKAIIAFTLLAILPTSISADLVINEIMRNPDVIYDGDGEWFEIYNPSASAVDINGWTIRDLDIDTHLIDNGGPLLVPAGGYLLVGNNADFATNGGVPIDYAYPEGFWHSNGADELILEDDEGYIVDFVAWDDGTVWPDTVGASMSLKSPELDNNIGSNWCASATSYGAGDLGTPGSENICTIPVSLGDCGDPQIFIHDVQGPGLSSPMVGAEDVILEGVVVGNFQPSGFFLQEEDSDTDGDPLTSEGIFIYGPGLEAPAGHVVRVMGEVGEYYGLTQLKNVVQFEDCGYLGVASPSEIILPLSAVEDWEAVEGMAVVFPQTLYVSGNYTLARYGEVELAIPGPLDQPTSLVPPGLPANTLQALNDVSRIQLDDGSTIQNPLPLPPFLGVDNTLRVGDSVAGLSGVVSYSFGSYEIYPTAEVMFVRENDRPSGSPLMADSLLSIASFNVLNYFTTLDDSGPICGPSADMDCRGADSVEELERQKAKLVSALTLLDADIMGLVELENATDDTPIADLVDGLNAISGPGSFAYIATAAIGTDAIRQGVIYKPASVTPVGGFAVLDSSVDPLFIDVLNRPVLAQTFEENSTGERFTIAVNHLKSKGSGCNHVGDFDTGDGQGNCNLTRTMAATALVNWLATDPTASGDPDFLIIGDLNAYAMEDPIMMIESAGYTDLVEVFVGSGFGNGAYSYNFDAQSGYLEHALASTSLLSQVSGAAFWHINADEPAGLDYNDYNQPGLFNPDQFRSSDHDPLLVGLFPDGDDDGIWDQADMCPGTVIPESVPTVRLGVNRFALTDGDTYFDTTPPDDGAPVAAFELFDTAGCSCEQIIEAQGLGKGHLKFGCSLGEMEYWVESVATP